MTPHFLINQYFLAEIDFFDFCVFEYEIHKYLATQYVRYLFAKRESSSKAGREIDHIGDEMERECWRESLSKVC